MVKFAKNGYELAKAGMFAEAGDRVTFENFMKFLRKKSGLSELELTAVFVGLDHQNKFTLTRDNFDNLLEKVAVIEKNSAPSKTVRSTTKRQVEEPEPPKKQSVEKPRSKGPKVM